MWIVNPARSIYPNLMSNDQNCLIKILYVIMLLIKPCLVCFRLKCVVRVLLNADRVRFRHVESRHEIEPGGYLCQNWVINVIQPSAGLGALDVDLVESWGLAAPIFCCSPAELFHKARQGNVSIRFWRYSSGLYSCIVSCWLGSSYLKVDEDFHSPVTWPFVSARQFPPL